MKRVIIAAVIIILLLGLGGAWLWSLGTVPMMDRGTVTLTVDAAPVEVERAGKNTWEQATSGMTLAASDQVRTDAGGRATINWYGRAETRLQERSMMTIDAASLSGASGDMGVAVHLSGGRIWSRILRLFDLDESFAATTNDVVATVRGTAFDLGVTSSDTSVWVTDSAVDIAEKGGQNPSLASHDPFAVADGHRVRQSVDGTWSTIETLTTNDLTSDWFMRNHAADQSFLRASQATIAEELARIGRVPSSGVMRTASSIGEWMHLIVAGADAPRLRAAYLMREINDVKKQIDEGRSGLAYQSVNTIARELDALLARPDGAASVPHLRRMFAMLSTLLHDDNADSPRYRLKQRMEEFMGTLSVGDRAEQIFTGLLAADARLDEVVALADEGRLADAKMGLDAAKQGVVNADRDVSEAANTLLAPRADALRSKIRAIRARIGALTERINIMQFPPSLTATSTESVLSTTTSSTPIITPTEVPPVATTSTLPVSTLPWDTLTLSAQPNPVTVGQQATLRLIGSRLDSSSADLTSQATFKLLGVFGSLKGSVFTASAPGSVTVEATMLDHGVSKSARTAIQVNDAVKLVSITVTPKGSTAVRPGAQVPLTVVATYSSGLTADVTMKTSWTTSDANIGSASGDTFSAWANGQGSVTITGSYSELGTTVQSAVVFTVSPQAALF